MATTTWGTFTRKDELREVLVGHLATRGIHGSWTLRVAHLPSGLTDNVFLLTITGDTGSILEQCILKEYTEPWHQREVAFYTNILSNHPSLGAPRKLLAHDNWLFLEYLQPSNFRPATKSDLPLLADWIVAKHRTFQDALPDSYAEPLDIQRHYLIDKPLNELRAQAKSGDYTNAATKILTTTDILPGLLTKHAALPQTLEHGDLEMQNILATKGSEPTLRIIDWVNARRGSGLFDINQLIENTKALTPDADAQRLIENLSEQLQIPNLEVLLDENRLLMILNKLHFCFIKQRQGHDQLAASKRSIHEHITSLLEEYLALIEKKHA